MAVSEKAYIEGTVAVSEKAYIEGTVAVSEKAYIEGTVAVSEKAYIDTNAILVHPLVWKHKCLSGVNATDCHKVLQVPSVGTTPVLESHIVSCVALIPQLQLCRLHWLLSVRHVSDVHSPVP